MAEFGNGLADESLLDSDHGHPELEDPGVGDEEPGLEEGEAAIEDPVSEGYCYRRPIMDVKDLFQLCLNSKLNQTSSFFSPYVKIVGHMYAVLLSPLWQ